MIARHLGTGWHHMDDQSEKGSATREAWGNFCTCWKASLQVFLNHGHITDMGIKRTHCQMRCGWQNGENLGGMQGGGVVAVQFGGLLRHFLQATDWPAPFRLKANRGNS